MRIRLIGLIVAVVSAISVSAQEIDLESMNAYLEFQKDADVVRLNHLKYYGELLEEFNSVTGSYPFMDIADVPVYVFVATEEQEKYATMSPPYEHSIRSFSEFVQVIEAGLGREINEYYDPQFAPDYKPNFYIYMAVQGTYFFAIHQNQEYSFSNKIADYYNKIEVSNNPNSQNLAKLPSSLFTNPEFISALNIEISKPEFFAEREEATLHATKQ